MPTATVRNRDMIRCNAFSTATVKSLMFYFVVAVAANILDIPVVLSPQTGRRSPQILFMVHTVRHPRARFVSERTRDFSTAAGMTSCYVYGVEHVTSASAGLIEGHSKECAV